jgi:hypothetical protein
MAILNKAMHQTRAKAHGFATAPGPCLGKIHGEKNVPAAAKKSTVPSDHPNKALESGESRAITAA